MICEAGITLAAEYCANFVHETPLRIPKSVPRQKTIYDRSLHQSSFIPVKPISLNHYYPEAEHLEEAPQGRPRIYPSSQ